LQQFASNKVLQLLPLLFLLNFLHGLTVLCHLSMLPHVLRLLLQLGSNDTTSAMQLFDDVVYGDLEQGSIYERSEANLTKASSASCIA
jgi:hypothetical protein